MPKLGLRILFVSAFFLICPFFVKAASVCADTTVVKVTARNASGAYIPNVSIDIYTQAVDADGNKKPGTRVGGGTTDATLGIANVSFRNSNAESATYAIRMRSIAKDSASFYFYDYTFSCGETASVSETLSGIKVSLFEADGDILTNTSFNIYTALYDTSDNLIEGKNELLGTFSSGSSGQVNVYVPQGSVRGITNLKDYYVLEVTHNNVKSYSYGIHINDGAMTDLPYYLSILRIRLKYASGTSATGTTVEVYTQKLDSSNEPQVNTKVGSFTIANNGYGSLEVSPGTYALKIKGGDGTYQYFYDNDVADGKTSEFLLTLKGGQASSGSSTQCSAASNINITLRDIAGNMAPGLKFEIYEQGTDANGLPTLKTKMAAGTINSTGQATVSFKPDTAKTYALKVWDKNQNLGDYWLFNTLKFTCGADRYLSKSLPSLKIVLRDASGTPKYNYAFSLYEQKYDVDNKPTFGAGNLIASLKTGSDGQAIVYVAPYDAYHNSQTGVYAVSTKDTNGNIKNFYNIQISADKDYDFDSAFSGITGELSDAQNRQLSNRTLTLYEQKTSGGYYVLGSKLFATKTDANGQFSFEYQTGTYAIVAVDDLGNANTFWNVTISTSKALQKLKASFISFKAPTNITSLKLYYLTGKGGTYYKGGQAGTIKLTNGVASVSLAAGPYLVSYASSSVEYGQAFYAKNGISYSLSLTSTAKYSLSGKISFSLSRAADANAVTVSNNSPAAAYSGSSSSLASKLKGRILLQIEDKGQAWYVNPTNGKKYSLGRPENAFNVMKKLALGVSNANFAAIEESPSEWKKLAGRILLKTEDNGKAYYFNAADFKLYYLGRPADAFAVMRKLGLGITTANLNTITSAE